MRSQAGNGKDVNEARGVPGVLAAVLGRYGHGHDPTPTSGGGGGGTKEKKARTRVGSRAGFVCT